jgi:thioredoxin 1
MAILENLASHVGPNVMIAEMNIDDARDLAVSLHIENIPTLLLFKDGQLRGRFFGVQPEARLAKAIEAARVG